jgi:hypothetical protein
MSVAQFVGALNAALLRWHAKRKYTRDSVNM